MLVAITWQVKLRQALPTIEVKSIKSILGVGNLGIRHPQAAFAGLHNHREGSDIPADGGTRGDVWEKKALFLPRIGVAQEIHCAVRVKCTFMFCKQLLISHKAWEHIDSLEGEEHNFFWDLQITVNFSQSTGWTVSLSIKAGFIHNITKCYELNEMRYNFNKLVIQTKIMSDS